jgi:hypothetical protein
MRTIIINEMRSVINVGTALIATLWSFAAHASVVHEYSVSINASLETMRVEARFGAPVENIRARSRDASRFIGNILDCDSQESLERNGRQLEIPGDGLSCLSYVVDLARAAAAERRNKGLAAGNIVVSPTVWLWHPPVTSTSRIQVRFDLPRDARVSVPWAPVDGRSNTFEVLPSPRNASAPAAFGDFFATDEELPGTTLRVAVLMPNGTVDAEAISGWVRATAQNVSRAYGRFPNPSPHILVIPVGRSGWGNSSPVPFGRVLRDGGESVELFINEHVPIEAFYDDWTATHELSHLMLPYLRSPHRWISEGFAQYYQNVLLARAGQYDEQRAWQKLYEGFERGQKSRPELSPNEAARRGVGAATMKIYWSGAIIALMADVELRRRSGGSESLDAALDQLQRCCLPAARSWSGTQLFETLDSFVDEPVFMPLYRRYANEAGFPEYLPVLEELGVHIEEDRVKLSNGADLAEIRRAITEIY